MSSLSPGGTLALGVIVGLLSTCVQSVGLTLQRKSHMLEDEKEDHLPRRAPYRRRRWQIGMLLFLLSNIIGSTIQITTLPLPLLSTLQASGLVFNALMATLLLKEPFTIRTTIGTVLVATGAVLISMFSAVPEPSHSLDQLLALLVVPNFIVWMSLTFLLVIVVLVATFCLNHLLPAHSRDRSRVRLIKGMCFGLVSGVLSAHALLLAKSAVELLVRTIVDHRNQFNRYQSWLLLVFFLVMALAQLYYLHLGLKLVTTSVLYPFVFCVYNIIAILDGLIYFRQTDRLPPLYAGLIALGTVILLSGVLALSWRLSEDEDEAGPGHAHIYASEIPPSALTPGMGFVDESVVAEDDLDPARIHQGDDPERAPLMQYSKRRHTLRDSALMTGRRRRRSDTFREREDIWDELGDTEQHYGAAPRARSDHRHPLSARSTPRHSPKIPVDDSDSDDVDVAADAGAKKIQDHVCRYTTEVRGALRQAAERLQRQRKRQLDT
ncbi:hypothetical protein AAFC00_001412 [Neodothiora populina]|uniref:Uncharacterized protein n=1 Tax=Neodothiora populina TaxID=2781224 RepID=A0ABR3PNV0_9PEZI